MRLGSDDTDLFLIERSFESRQNVSENSFLNGPNRTTFYMNSCFPRVTTERADFEEIVAGYYDQWDIALQEDIDVLERQQLGMAAPLARPGRYSYLESAVGHFERWIAG